MVRHVPVLPRETIENLVKDIDGSYLDCTAGHGGHIRLILDRLSPKDISNFFSFGLLSGILFDLGFSAGQIYNSERGFSYRLEGPLDMRMNREQSLKAEEIIVIICYHSLEEKIVKNFLLGLKITEIYSLSVTPIFNT
nr:ribosomal RNA small subunit methyltransferase H-like [Lytechinus pictus]